MKTSLRSETVILSDHNDVSLIRFPAKDLASNPQARSFASARFCEMRLWSLRITRRVLCVQSAMFFLTALFATACSAPAATPPVRDWSINPAVVEIDTKQDVYSLGDIHGDYKALVKLLEGAQVIPRIPARPEEIEWSAGKSILICTGDLIDRYDQSLQVIACLRALQDQAARAGGRVIITMGNHEAVFLASGGHDKINSDFVGELKGAGMSVKDVAIGRDADGLGKFLRSLPIAARINDWFFCHAGNTHGLSIKELAEQIQTGVDAIGFAAPILSDPGSLLEARMHPRPWWEADSPEIKKIESRGNRSAAAEKKLRDLVAALGVKHLVFGHQPVEVAFADKTHRKADEIFTKFDGLIFMIDTGMSRGVDNTSGAILKIHQENGASSVVTINSAGKSQPLWPSVK